MKQLLLFLLAGLGTVPGNAQSLTIIEQDYARALSIAAKEDKLLLVDFYTTWCVPCKQLDHLLFQNESVKKSLAKDFVLLQYNAEKDSVFNLSKKHHVMSYPTGLVLNSKGYVLNRKYGFPGDDFLSLCKSLFEFVNESVELDQQHKVLKGYTNSIDLSTYPAFYIDYVNRSRVKIDSLELKQYWRTQKDIFSEAYFSTLIYFADWGIPDALCDRLLKNKPQYEMLYGKTDVNVLFYFISAAKFKSAIEAIDQSAFDKATNFMATSLGQQYIDEVLPGFKKNLLKKQGKWQEVFGINKTLKDSGRFSDGAVNYFCWDVYKHCDDQQVMMQCLGWMKELTDREPEFAYLDTYSFLLYKSGDRSITKEVVERAIQAARAENEDPAKLEALLKKL